MRCHSGDAGSPPRVVSASTA
ncbi:hypothetical protein ABT338_32495 [Streptosporangium saharense]